MESVSLQCSHTVVDNIVHYSGTDALHVQAAVVRDQLAVNKRNHELLQWNHRQQAQAVGKHNTGCLLKAIFLLLARSL